MKKKTIFVGLSGGVDSAVSVALLKKDGYEKIDLETANGKAKLMLTNHNDKDLANMFLIHNGYFYRLTWNAVPELRHQYAETFKQMVASFKFL